MKQAAKKLFEDLASADEAVRIEAARELHYYDRGYFNQSERYRFSDAQINALLDTWHATSSDLVRLWIAQGFAFTTTERDDALAIVVQGLEHNGPYSETLAHFLYTRRNRLADGDRLMRSLHRHPDSGVRWRSAMYLRSLSWGGLDRATDIPLLHTLMLDDAGIVRMEAVLALSQTKDLGPDDYEVLLDVVNSDNGAARHYAKELMARMEKDRPDCTPSAFTPRMPRLRTDGVYRAERAELDQAGNWISSACLRFFEDGSVHAFGTNAAPVDFPDLMPRLSQCKSQGKVSQTGDSIAFTLSGATTAAECKGRIDGNQIHLSSTRTGSNRIEEIYTWSPVDWHSAPREPVPRPANYRPKKQPSLPFIPAQPQSMRISDAKKWYLQMVARLPGLIEQEGDPAKRAELAWHIKDQLRKTAATAMYDSKGLKQEFFAKLPLPPLTEIQSLPPEVAISRLLTITREEMHAFPGTVGEAIGLEYHLHGQVWVMTEEGWALRE